MKKFLNTRKKEVIMLFLVCITSISNAQVTDGQYKLSITNATATANTIDVTLTVTVLGPAAGMRLYGYQTSINFDSAIVNGGTISASYIGGRSPELSAMSFGSYGVATAGCVRMSVSYFSGGSTSVDMAQGTTLTLGTYRITNSANWANANANLWLQDVPLTGRTRSAVNGYPFGQATPQYAYTTVNPVSPPGVVLSNLAATPYSLELGALNTANFDVTGFKFYPNEVIDILNVSYSKNIESISLYNLIGQEVMTKKIKSNNAKLDLNSYPSGTYLMRVLIEDGTSKTVKVVKK